MFFNTSGDRRRHLYVIGQTGTGKSAFLSNLIEQDINSGQGLGILDPHGDLVDDILGKFPMSVLTIQLFLIQQIWNTQLV